MKVMVIVHPGDKKGYEAGAMPETKLIEDMCKFNEELVDAGVMLSGEGLHPSTKGIRVTFPANGKQTVTNGPFADSLIGGFWLWQVKSMEDALNWARRAPMEPDATLEIRPLFEMEDFGDAVTPEIAAQEEMLRKKLAAK